MTLTSYLPARIVRRLRRVKKLPASVQEAMASVQDEVEHLDELLARRCKHCSKPVAVGENCCASCADGAGP